MEDGRKKLRFCLVGIILVAIIAGLIYYCTGNGTNNNPEGILVRNERLTEYGI